MGADNRVWYCWHDDPEDVLMFYFAYGTQETPEQVAEAYAALFMPAPEEVFCRLEAGRVHRVLL